MPPVIPEPLFQFKEPVIFQVPLLSVYSAELTLPEVPLKPLPTTLSVPLPTVPMSLLLFLSPVFFPVRVLAAAYTDLFRGFPFIIVLYLVGFGVPTIAVGAISAYTAGVGAHLYLQVAIIAALSVAVSFSSSLTWAACGAAIGRWLRAPIALRLFNLLMAALLLVSVVPILGEIWTELQR